MITVKRSIGGKTYSICYPVYETELRADGTMFTCNRWPDRLSDCRINDRPVSAAAFRRRRDAWKRDATAWTAGAKGDA